MSDFSAFMKQNKKVRPNEFYAPTKYLVDENGDPIRWEFRHISARENQQLIEESQEDVLVGKRGQYRTKTRSAAYVLRLITASVVYPDLRNAELMDSYGVSKPEDLLLELVDDPGEYTDLASFVQEMQGFNPVLDLVETAKN